MSRFSHKIILGISLVLGLLALLIGKKQFMLPLPLQLFQKEESTFAMIKPDASTLKNFELINNKLKENNLYIHQWKSVWLSESLVSELYEEHFGKSFYPELTEYITSGPVIIMEVRGVGSIKAWRKLIGPTDPAIAKLEAPNSIRSLIGKSKTINSVHGSDSLESAHRELNIFFSKDRYNFDCSLSANENDKDELMLYLSNNIAEETLNTLKRKIEYNGLEIIKELIINSEDYFEINEIEELKKLSILSEIEVRGIVVKGEYVKERINQIIGAVPIGCKGLNGINDNPFSFKNQLKINLFASELKK